MNSLMEVVDCLRGGKKAVICGHSMPDGDSVGSVLAMSFLLRAIGIECYVVTSDGVPAMYSYLPGVNSFLSCCDLPESCDLAVVLDCTDLNRLGEDIREYIDRIPKVVNVDHHVSNQFFGHCNYVDATAAATGEIVHELVALLGVPLSKDIAINLYSAIVMDTGSFKFDNTTDKTHEVAAKLIRTGIDTGQINRNLFEKKDLVHLKLLGYAMGQLATAAGGKVAWVTIPFAVMQEFGARDEHADGIINYPRTLDGVEVGLLFREVSPGKFKIGFRSKKNVDVNQLAANFGGGGHPRASGCLLEGTREEVEQKVVDMCIRFINKVAEEEIPL